jgi:transcriptional regulator with XRE-family HTH domain
MTSRGLPASRGPPIPSGQGQQGAPRLPFNPATAGGRSILGEGTEQQFAADPPQSVLRRLAQGNQGDVGPRTSSRTPSGNSEGAKGAVRRPKRPVPPVEPRVLTRKAGGLAGQYRASKGTVQAPTAEQVGVLAQLVDYLESKGAKSVVIPPREKLRSLAQAVVNTVEEIPEIEEIEESVQGDEFYDAEEGSPLDYFAEPVDHWAQEEPGFCGMINVNSGAPSPDFEELLPENDVPYEVPELCEGTRKRYKTNTLQELEGGIPIFAKENYHIPPRCQATFPIRWGKQPPKGTVWVIKPAEGNAFSNQILGGHCLVEVFEQPGIEMCYMVANLRNDDVVLPTVLPLGYAFPVDRELLKYPEADKQWYVPLRAVPKHIAVVSQNMPQELLDHQDDPEWQDLVPWVVNPEDKPNKSCLGTDPSVPVPECTLTEEQKEQCEKYRITEPTLTTEQKLRLLQLLQKYDKVFSKGGMDMGECNIEKVHIDTGDAKPISCNPHRLAYNLRPVLRGELDELQGADIIESSNSPWAAPCLYVPKKDGTWRLCVDFRKLNAVIKPMVYPLPRIEDIFDTLEGSIFFSAIDLAKGFWQIALDDESKAKAAFTTIYGQFQYRRLPFGLATSPGAFRK